MSRPKGPRSAAEAQGERLYWTGKPCVNGHFAFRRTRNSHCIECDKIRFAKVRAATRQCAEKLARSRRWSRESNARNRERVLARQRAWYARNRDAILAKRAPLNAERCKSYYQSHREKLLADAAIRCRKRYQKLAHAVPSWVRAEVVASIYRSARKITASSGIRHEVDHIVPLRSKLVCGLHCEDNLAVITKFANRDKSNRYWPDMPE